MYACVAVLCFPKLQIILKVGKYVQTHIILVVRFICPSIFFH